MRVAAAGSQLTELGARCGGGGGGGGSGSGGLEGGERVSYHSAGTIGSSLNLDPSTSMCSDPVSGIGALGIGPHPYIYAGGSGVMQVKSTMENFLLRCLPQIPNLVAFPWPELAPEIELKRLRVNERVPRKMGQHLWHSRGSQSASQPSSSSQLLLLPNFGAVNAAPAAF